MNRWTRREMLGTLGRLPLLAALAAVAAACGGSGGAGTGYGGSGGGGGGGSGATQYTCSSGIPDYTIDKHYHDACLTTGELNSSTDITITITGPHTHSLDISAVQLANLRAGMDIELTSHGGSHTHTVTYLG